MKFCKKCGNQISHENAACPNCGHRNSDGEVYSYGNYGGSELNTTGILVWSIINLLCCIPLGGLGIFFAFQARSAQTTEEAQKHMKRAKLICIIGTIGGIIILAMRIFYFR